MDGHEKKRDVYMFFQRFKKKTCDKVSKEVMWWILEKKQVSNKYINAVKYMYNEEVTRMTTIRGGKVIFNHYRLTS